MAQSPESSPTDLITLILYHLNQWLAAISNLFTTLFSDLINFFPPETVSMANQLKSIKLNRFTSFITLILYHLNQWLAAISNLFTTLFSVLINFFPPETVSMANQLKSIKLNRFTSFITLILYHLNQWLAAISNLFTTLFSVLINFFPPETVSMANQLKSIKLNRFTSFITLILYHLNQWLAAISNLFTTLFSVLINFFPPETVSMANQLKSIKLNRFTSFITLILYHLNQWLAAISNLFTTLFFDLTNFFPPETVSMANQLKSIKLNRFTSFITLILYHLNQWLAAISNLFTTLFSDLTNFFSPETRALLADHWLMVAAGGVLLVFFMCCCLPAILRCLIWVLVACFNLIVGLFMMLFYAIMSVFRFLCCCGGRSGKMMRAPGTGGRHVIPRAGFEINPAAYFQNLRARAHKY